MRLALFLLLSFAVGGYAAESSLGMLAGERSSAHRTAYLRLALETASATEIENRLGELLAAERSATGAQEYLVAIEWLARRAGARAMEFASRHPYPTIDDARLRRTIVRGWATADFDAAMTWIRAQPLVSADRNEIVELALRRRAAIDPEAAMRSALREAARSADPISARENYVAYVLEALADRGEFESAHRLVTNVVPADVRESALANLVGLSAEHRPDLAVAWFRAMPTGDAKTGALMRLEEVLAEIRPDLALAVFGELDASACTPDLVDLMIWHAAQPRREWMEKLVARLPTGEAADPVITSAILKLAAIDLAAVPWPWFERITSDAARKSALLRVVSGAAAKDKSAALALLARAPFLTEKERAAARAKLNTVP